MFDVVRNARRAAAGAPSLPRSTQPDPLLALDIEHREALAAYKATDAGDAEFEAVAERQTGLVDKLVNTTATSLEGVLVKLRYVLSITSTRPATSETSAARSTSCTMRSSVSPRNRVAPSDEPRPSRSGTGGDSCRQRGSGTVLG